MIEWRRVVQSYPCMVCGAAPGKECVTSSGRGVYVPHYLRSKAASENGWRSPEEGLDDPVGRVGHSENPSRREEW